MAILTYIVPCYNREKEIIETLDSIKSSKLNDFECIIVNDGSTDSSESVINDFIANDKRFKLLSFKKNYGPSKARNLALKNASGKYILPIDSDDLVEREYGYNGVNFLENNLEYSLYYGRVCYVKDGKETIPPIGYISYGRMLINDCITVSGIYRRDKALEIGGYDENLIAMEDFDFWIRYLYHNDKIKFSDEVGFKYRIHNNSRHFSKTNDEINRVRHQISIKNRYIYDEFLNAKRNILIDVIIPCHEKDYDTLSLCLRSIYENIEDEIKDIFIVSKETAKVKEICEEYKCTFINEEEYMGFSPKDMTRIREDKRGWLFQQLIKLKGNIGTCKNYLVIDADVLLIKKYKFINNDLTPNFIMSNMTPHKTYDIMNEKLTGYINTEKEKEKLNFVSDKMLFNINYIKQLQRKIEKHTKEKTWMDAIINNFDNDVDYSFSEFQLYGAFMKDKPHTKSYPLENHIKKPKNKTYEELRKIFRDTSAVTFFN